MTSANVTEYKVFRNGVEVATHRQHHLCKDRSRELLRFTPLEEHTIQATWHDEEEEYHESEPVILLAWLGKQRWFAMAGRISEPRGVFCTRP